MSRCLELLFVPFDAVVLLYFAGTTKHRIEETSVKTVHIPTNTVNV